MSHSFYRYLNFIESYKDQVAIQYYDNSQRCVQAVTYTQLVEDVRKAAIYLRTELPNVDRQKIGVLAHNGYPCAIAVLAVFLAGAVLVPLNYEENPVKLQEQIDFAEVTCVLHDGHYFEREGVECFQTAYCKDFRKIDEVIHSAAAGDLVDNSVEDRLAMIMFTSGTTGKNKGVMLSQRNIFAPLQGYEDYVIKFRKQQIIRNFIVMPFYHVTGISQLMVHLYLGNVINLCCDIKYIYRDVRIMDSDLTCVFPAVLKSWEKDLKKGKKERLGTLKGIVCGASMVDVDTLKTFVENGIPVAQAYGLTEIFGGGTLNDFGRIDKIASVGKPHATCQLRIAEDGEVCLKSDAVMLGYYKDPEETAKVIQDGWLHTGDLGYLDADGYLYLTGRKKNLIILSGGENVNPEELEKLVLQCPAVKEAIVRQEEDKIVAEVFCDEGKNKEVQDYVTAVNRNLPGYKRMVQVRFRTDPFPRTGSGKIKRE